MHGGLKVCSACLAALQPVNGLASVSHQVALTCAVLQATVETVIKVSGNAKQREEKDRAREKVEARDKAAGLPPPKPAQGKHKGGLFWGTEEASPPPPPPTPAPPPAKAKEKQRMEANVEQEVDRIIDSQDNVYVLSRPK